MKTQDFSLQPDIIAQTSGHFLIHSAEILIKKRPKITPSVASLILHPKKNDFTARLCVFLAKISAAFELMS